ncbi:MAG TPA: NAD(P)H-hydrate dehydratase [Trueperaceae bacterium]
MMLFLGEEMRRADELAEEAGVPTRVLMEAAGGAVARSALHNFPAARRVLILCGTGNNGGDGYVAARYLLEAGAGVELLELPGERRGDAQEARDSLAGKLSPTELDAGSLGAALERSDLVIDALFGSGLSRPLAGDVARLVDLVNRSGLPLLAVDIPSGVSSDSPHPPGSHIRANRTVQLAGAKLSSAFEPARSAYGEMELADIGIPKRILEEVSTTRLLGPEVGRGIPRRAREAHKYEVGTVLVLAGSAQYLGAAELTCRGAYRAGAGLVTLAAEARLASSWPEIVFAQLSWNEDPAERLEAVAERRAGAIVAGPGLDRRALPYLPRLLAARPVPWVLDAGALEPDPALRQAVREHGSCVLTPHAGEASKLLGCSAGDITREPLAAARRIAEEWNSICVLKGVGTVVASPGTVAVSTEGHEGMASGGTGDVLAGVLGAFLAAPGAEDPVPRVEAGVVVHGLAGRLAGEQLGIGMIASDLVARVPLAMRTLSGTPPGP